MSRIPTWDETEALEETTNVPTWDDTISFEEAEPGFLESAAETAGDFAQGVAQGATFDFADEIRAGIEAGVLNPLDAIVRGQTAFGDEGLGEALSNIRQNYQRALGTQREQIVEAQERSPGAFMTGEIAGAITPYLIPAGAAAGALGGVGRAATAAPTAISKLGTAAKGAGALAKIGRGAAAGSVDAALRAAGASTAENVGDFTRDVAGGAALGAAFGGAIPGIGAAAKGTAKGTAQLFNRIAEDKPFFGAIKAGLKGIKGYSARQVRQNIVPKIEKLADDLIKVGDDIGDDIAKPARQKIQDAYVNATKETAEQLKLKGDEFTNFVNKSMRSYGQAIREAEEAATARGTRLDIKDILLTAKQKVDEVADDLIETDQKIAKEFSDLFERKIYQQIDIDKEVSKQFKKAIDNPTPVLTKQSTKVGGKEVTPQELDEALSLFKIKETLPKGTSEKVVRGPKGETITKTTRETLKALKPIDDVSVKQAKNLSKALGAKSVNPNIEDSLRRISGETYGNLKSAVEDAIANSIDNPQNYFNAKSKFTAIKEALETAGVKDLPKDLTSGEIITPKQFSKIFDKLGKFASEGNIDDPVAIRIFSKLREVDEQVANKFQSDLTKISQVRNLLKKGTITDPVKQAQVLKEAGLLDDAGMEAFRQVEEGKLLQDVLEGSPLLRESGVSVPRGSTYEFILDTGEGLLEGNRPGRSGEIEGLYRALREYAPDFADDLAPKAKEAAELARVFSPVSRSADGAGAEAALSPRGVAVGGLPALIIGAGNLLGLGAREAGRISGIPAIAKVMQSNPQMLGRFQQPLIEAAERGPQALASTIYVLSQQDEDFRKLQEDIDKAGENVNVE